MEMKKMGKSTLSEVLENKHVQLIRKSSIKLRKKQQFLLDFCVNIDGNPAGFEKMKKRLSRLEYKINGCL